MEKSSEPRLSTEPYKGTRDFYPEDQFVQNYIFSTMKKVVEKYGYSEYGASILEETDLYRAKSGSELVNEQVYSFIDRGGRDVTIRPEMTPTVARMVAARRQELAFPLRWYSIPNLFRYERPQRGRLREHWQLNVDIFGIESLFADIEIIRIANDIMVSFGAKVGQYQIRINNRKLVNFLIHEFFELDAESGYKLTKLIDRKSKMSDEDFEVEAEKLVGSKVSQLKEILLVKDVEELPEELQVNRGVEELKILQEGLKVHGVTDFIFDPTLVRGFDYYTGTVFEVFDTGKENSRSLFGGGRYDDLVSIFGSEAVSGVGFGMGDVTIRDFLEVYGLLPKYNPPTKLYVCVMEDGYANFADQLADYLRQSGVNVMVDYSGKKIEKQLKSAEKQQIPFVICIGQQEVETKVFRLKNMFSRSEEETSWGNLPEVLR